MKLHYKINLTSLGILITVTCAMAVAGVIAINQVTYDLNRKLMMKEVGNLLAKIQGADQILSQSGVAEIESSQQRAKQNLLGEFEHYTFGKTGELMVVQKDGIVPMMATKRHSVDEELLKTMARMGAGSMSNEHNGESRFYCFASYPGWNWLVVLSVRTEEMLDVRNKFLINVALILMSCLGFGGLMLLWSTDRIVRPIRQLAKAADAISHGKWDTAFPRIEGKDEISQLSYSFKEMSENLASSYHDLNANFLKVKKSQEDLFAEKERLAVTLRSIGDGVISTDAKGCITLVNKVAEDLTGWSQEESLEQPVEDVFRIVTQTGGKRTNTPILRIIKSGGTDSLSGKTILVARDGSEKIISASGAPIFDGSGKALGIILVFRDITERVEMEEEIVKAHKLESVGILAGGIAHDFNNILTAILGNISLAKMYADPNDTIYKKLEDTEKASHRAKNLTKQLLTFSRGGEPIKKVVSLAEIIRDSSLFALTGSNCRCEFKLAPDLWTVEADDGQVSQVIHNLIINACQAMPHGGTIQVYADNVAVTEKDGMLLDPGNFIRVSVNDCGTGISKRALPRIFDPYFTTKENGSGLGLASAYSIIKKHDGCINVESEQGVGSSFQIYLPSTNKIKQKNEHLPQELNRGCGRVLVMDDEVIVREVTGTMLASLGYEVEYAAEGEQALRMYQERMNSDRRFDAVIMDLTVPGGMGGKEAIRQLLEIDPGARAIVASGYANDPIMANHADYGFLAVLSKPFNIEYLAQALDNLLKN